MMAITNLTHCRRINRIGMTGRIETNMNIVIINGTGQQGCTKKYAAA